MRSSVLVLALASCGSQAPVSADAPGVDTAPGDASADSPTDADTRPRILVLLHSYGSTGAGLANEWRAAYWQNRAHVITPEGTLDGSGKESFNASGSCCDPTMADQDEAAIVADIAAEVAVEGSARVYVAGLSNGGFMAERLACDHPELVAAAVDVSGAGRSESDAPCPANRAPTLLVHGTADIYVKYDTRGKVLQTMPDQYLTAQETIDQYGCGPLEVTDTRDYDTAIVGAEAAVMTAPGCKSEHWRLNGSSHSPSFNDQWRSDVWAWLESR